MTTGDVGNDSTGTAAPAGCAADLHAAIEDFSRAVEVLTGGWDLLDDATRNDAYVTLETARRKLAIVDAEYLSATARGRVVKPTPAVMRRYTENMRVSRAEARRRISAAHRLQRPEVQRVEPKHDLPQVRRRVAEGVAGADAVAFIDDALKGLPKKAEDLIHTADPHIANLLDKVQVDDLKYLGPMLRALLGLDDPYTDEDRQRQRAVRLSKPDVDNMSRISGHVTPEFAAILRRLFADYAAPGSLLPKGARDDRSADQRRHDAMEAAVAAGFGAPGSDDDDHDGADAQGKGDPGGPSGGPTDGGCTPPAPGPDSEPGSDSGSGPGSGSGSGPEPVDPVPDLRPKKRLRPKRGTTSIVVSMHISELAAMTGTALTDVSSTMSIGEAIRGADASNVFLSVMDFRGSIMWFGRSRRYGTMHQYLALCAEEGMSTAPGSSSPPAYCDIHHIDSWNSGGGTDIDGLTLADYVMHGRVDDDRADEDRWWTRRRGQSPGTAPPGGFGDDNPKVQWIPPSSMDPDRAPRENHHPLGWLAPGRRIRRYFARRGRTESDPDADAGGG